MSTRRASISFAMPMTKSEDPNRQESIQEEAIVLIKKPILTFVPMHSVPITYGGPRIPKPEDDKSVLQPWTVSEELPSQVFPPHKYALTCSHSTQTR